MTYIAVRVKLLLSSDFSFHLIFLFDFLANGGKQGIKRRRKSLVTNYRYSKVRS